MNHHGAGCHYPGAQILQLIKVLQQEMSMGVIFITHDMGVVRISPIAFWG
ncbi:Glutathione import ATP-binding protein GsiA [Salmonella enterica subsp. enterica]|nr:Glutathione import ATP-binding protein GsiA [Salmonella enterica subsp. enterica]